LQARGVRVEVVACENVSRDLRREADMFMSAYLIPGLIPLAEGGNAEETNWGETGSRVRGICHFHKSGYGFMRYLDAVSENLWHTDSRDPASPYETVFFNDSDLPATVDAQSLPSRDCIFEFELAAPRSEGEARQAIEIDLIHRL
ncbi:MAG: NYN domain-containing protein, partial [Pseudomonadota bacterium]